jgi:hypothetical protein
MKIYKKNERLYKKSILIFYIMAGYVAGLRTGKHIRSYNGSRISMIGKRRTYIFPEGMCD